MIKTVRVMLIPNNKQKTKLFQYANTARFAYNWALGREKDNYKNGGKFIPDKDLKLSDRIYKCECGNVIDRDFQAALNLKQYGENVLKRSAA